MIFSVGNSVQLRSGGLPMTVEKIEGDMATCVWLDKLGKDRTRQFSVQMLMHDLLGASGDLIFVGYDGPLEAQGNA